MNHRKDHSKLDHIKYDDKSNLILDQILNIFDEDIDLSAYYTSAQTDYLFVPYSGATRDIDLGHHNLSLDSIQFDISHSGTTIEGQLVWNDLDKTLNLGLESGSVLQIGQETLIRVVNKSGFDIANGAAVFINGAQGQRATISLADYRSETGSTAVIGLVTTTGGINNNNNGYVCVRGLVRDLNLSNYIDGDILYLYTGGTYTTSEPVAPLHRVKLGIVTNNSATDGSILVQVALGSELGELHDVLISGQTNGQMLVYDSLNSYWKNSNTINSLSASTINTTFLSANTINTIYETINSGLTISNFNNATERIITTSGSGLLQNYLQTDNQFITDSTLITNLLSGANWTYNTYTGTIVGAVEGQNYNGDFYQFSYQNSNFKRIKYETSVITLFTTNSTATTTLDIGICSASTNFTLVLAKANTMVYNACTIKNIGSSTITLQPTSPSLIDYNTTQPLPPNSTLQLFVYNNNYYIK
jgi:hypothetical protein